VAALKCCNGIALRETRHAPASYRRPDQMHWPRSWPLEEFAEQVSIESRNREPLCSAGRAGEYVDVLSAKSALAHNGESLRACAKCQC
jgi:hypothetical protein